MQTARRHDIDALRVFLFGSLILYHVGMLYVADWPFHLKSSYSSEALQVPMLLVNRWRMPLLFVVSGIALAFLHRKLRARALVANRTRRILVPLLFGTIVIVPIQPYCEGVSRHLVEPGFGRFLIHYFTFRPWPEGAFVGSDVGITWNHLWFLAYVWVYSVVVVAAMPLLESRAGRAIRSWARGLRGGWLLLVPAVPKTIALATLGAAFPPTGDLVRDWYQHAVFFPFFLLGFWIAVDDGIWQEIRSSRKRVLALACINGAAYLLVLQVLLPEDAGPWLVNGARVLSGLNTWLWMLAVLGWSAHWLDRPFRWLPYATEAVLPWYLLHQSLMIAIAYWLIPLRIGGLLEASAVIAFTTAGCLLLHETLIRRVDALRFLFGLKPWAKSAIGDPKAGAGVDAPFATGP